MKAEGAEERQVVASNMAHTYKVDLDWAYPGEGRKPISTTAARPTTASGTTAPPVTTGPSRPPTTAPITSSGPTAPPVTTAPPITQSGTNQVSYFRLTLVKLGQGAQPNTTSYEIVAVIDVVVPDKAGAMVSVVDSVNSTPVTQKVFYPKESVSVTLHREDLSPGQVVTGTCSITNGNQMSSSVTAP